MYVSLIVISLLSLVCFLGNFIVSSNEVSAKGSSVLFYMSLIENFAGYLILLGYSSRKTADVLTKS